MTSVHSKEITLSELLRSRDNRAAKQLALIRNNPNKTLAVLTVVMPGNLKRTPKSLKVATAACTALNKEFPDIEMVESLDLQTGYEAYFITSLAPCETKRIACLIEEQHPLGRLFDIDVISTSGIPVSRIEIGVAPRKCILCDKEARICMREKNHTYEELTTHINNIVDSYE